MKNFKKWNKKIKINFAIRIFSLLLTIALLVGVVAARGQVALLVAAGSYVASIVVISLIIIFEVWRIYTFIQKIDTYFEKVKRLEDANSDPEFIKKAINLRNVIEKLDINTITIIKQVVAKEKVSKKQAEFALSETEKAIIVVQSFSAEYPKLKPTGVKDPQILLTIFGKRVLELKEYLK